MREPVKFLVVLCIPALSCAFVARADDPCPCDGGSCAPADRDGGGGQDGTCEGDEEEDADAAADAQVEALPDSDEPRPDGKSLVGCEAAGEASGAQGLVALFALAWLTVLGRWRSDRRQA